MRAMLLAAVLPPLASLAFIASANADDAAPWRATSRRVELAVGERRLELVVPRGRARGATSRSIPIDAGETYVALARLELDTLVARGAFVRVALYERADGRGRQRVRLDSLLLKTGADHVVVLFEAPGWARAAKLRVLARPDRDGVDVAAGDVALVRVDRAPEVVLRFDE